MLNHLHISNFAIVRALELDWRKGMTTITGETGAGKSIALDALSLCLGERADGSIVRPSADKADIVATFDVTHLESAKHWLHGQDLAMGNECIVRRVVSSEGRSRAYINGVQVPAQQLKALGQHLLSIHGQHAHQLLLKNDYQRQLVDAFADNSEALQECRSCHKIWLDLKHDYAKLQQSQQQREAQRQLLEYQVAELNQFAPSEHEFSELENEQQKLSHSHSLIQTSQQALQLLTDNDDGNSYQLVRQAGHLLEDYLEVDSDLQPMYQSLQDALIQLEEASRELRRYSEKVDVDPERLQEIDRRLSQWLQLARKHQIAPEQLFVHHQQLLEQLQALAGDDDRLNELTTEIQEAQQHYAQAAEKLTLLRQDSALKLSALIAKSMAELSMPNARFHVSVDSQGIERASKEGWDQVEFLVSTNPGQPLQALHKVASGGELSRISLAIQVILAGNVTTPTLIFDEVDVGISGPVAAGVGRLLRQLGDSTQVICVTHLPQVASQGHQQLFVEKYTDGIATETRIRTLTDEERVQEIARLLAGENVSANAIANARELLCAL